jgi:xanthine/uracil permease
VKDLLTYCFEDKLIFWQYLIFGLQNLLVMDSVFATPVILGTALHLSTPAFIYLIQATLIGAGITTILQSATSLRLPIALGMAASVVGVVITLASLGVNLATIITGIIISTLFIGILLIPIILSHKKRR